jgi:hypothetical protein
MKFGRLDEEAGLQEGPYAMRLSANGALRATLTGKPSLELLHAVRTGSSHAELRRLFKAAVKEMP